MAGNVRKTRGAATKHNPKVILIGGSSHVGKSTLAASLATNLSWSHISTDRLAYNALMIKAVNQHGFTLIDATQTNVSKLTQTCRSNLGIGDQ